MADFQYLRIAEILIEQIQNGTYEEGQLLPSENTLREKYGISRTTVRRALLEMSKRGFVKSMQGKGTVVMIPRIRQELSRIYGFAEDMSRLGKKAETRVLDFVEVLANDSSNRRIGIPEDSRMYRIMRVRIADGESMLLETNYLPCDRFPDLSREMLEDRSLYDVLCREYDLKIDVAEETFEPVILRPMEMQIFGVPNGTLGMMVERISFENGRIIEFSKSVSPAVKFKYHIVLTN